MCGLICGWLRPSISIYIIFRILSPSSSSQSRSSSDRWSPAIKLLLQEPKREKQSHLIPAGSSKPAAWVRRLCRFFSCKRRVVSAGRKAVLTACLYVLLLTVSGSETLHAPPSITPCLGWKSNLPLWETLLTPTHYSVFNMSCLKH